MIYNRGTIAQCEAVNLSQMQANGWTEEEINKGKINFIRGVPAPDHQRSIREIAPIINPNNPDDCIWLPEVTDLNLPQLNQEDRVNLGWDENLS